MDLTLLGKFWFFVLPSAFEPLEQNSLGIWILLSISMRYKL